VSAPGLHSPWIGSVTDGRRDVVTVQDQHGRTVYVHVESILLDCDTHASAEDAREWARRMGLATKEAPRA
jgi:hypothetical protein